jgi:hypothetical protein
LGFKFNGELNKMPRVLDPKKVNVRCDQCGAMTPWCEECKKFLCKRCKNAFSLTDGILKNEGKADCGCGKKKGDQLGSKAANDVVKPEVSE